MYYSNFVLIRRAPELITRIVVTESCVCKLLSSFLWALISGPVRYSGDFDSAEGITTSGVLLPTPVTVQNFVQSVCFLRNTFECKMIPIEDDLAHSRSLEMDWETEGCSGSYPYNDATDEARNVFPCSVRCQKQVIHKCFPFCKA